MDKNIRQFGRQWLITLKDIARQGGRVGEIDLTEKQTREFSQELQKVIDQARYFDNEMATALAVVAVNLAYYYYEGSGGGSFFKYLVPENSEERKEIIRVAACKKIEDFLFRYEFISERMFGRAYRYIGSIIRQAIVTKHYLPRLAYYIERFDQVRGLENMERLPFAIYGNDFENLLSRQRFQEGILIETLRKPEGFTLLRTISILIDQVRSRQLSPKELKELKGFRSGFWDAFERLYEGREKKFSVSRPRFRYPAFNYHAGFNQVGISFDEIGVSQRAYHVEIDSRKQLVETDFLPFHFDHQLESPIQAFIDRDSEILIDVWLPDAESTFQALFEVDQGTLVSSVNHPKNSIRPGVYHLVTLGELDENVKSALGLDFSITLEIEGEEWYEVWSAEVKPGTDLGALGKCVEEKAHLGLQWEEPVHLPGTAPNSGIFAGSLPRLIIRGWNKLKHRFQVVVKYPDKDIPAPISEEDLQVDENDAFFAFEPKVYQQGLIKIQVSGSSTLTPDTEELRFLLLPRDFKLSWSHHLLGIDEPPKVTIRSETDPLLEWSQECQVQKGENEVIYIFRPGTDIANGKSRKIPGLNFQLFFLNARAFPKIPPAPSTRKIIWSSNLDDAFDFKIQGHKRHPLELGVVTQEDVFSLWKDVEGRYTRSARIQSLDLKDGILGKPVGCGRFAIKFGDTWKKTDCVFINENNIIEALIQLKESFFYFLPQDLEDTFRAALNLINDGGTSFEVTSKEKLSFGSTLTKFFTFLEAGSTILDRQESINFAEDKYKGIPCVEWFTWYQDACKNEQNPMQCLLSMPDAGLPSIERWSRQLEEFISQIKKLTDLPALLSDFEKDVDDPLAPPRAEISRLKEGKNLRRAVKYYRNGKYPDVFQILHQMNAQGLSKSVLIIKESAYLLAKLRAEWKVPQQPPTEANTSDPWDHLLFQIRILLDLYHQDGLDTFAVSIENYSSLKNLFALFCEYNLISLIDSLGGRNGSQIKKLAANDLIILFLLHKNQGIRAATAMEPNEIINKLKNLQEKGIVPPSVTIE
jgi:hypothetical protein